MRESFLFLLFFEQVYHIIFVCVHIGLGLRTGDVEHNLGDVATTQHEPLILACFCTFLALSFIFYILDSHKIYHHQV